MPNVQDLVDQYNGHVFGITGPDQGQCTAVAHAWEGMCGLPIVYGNAIDTFANAPDELYHKELNTPEGVPTPGAIMVWDSQWGEGFGHTAVVVSANVNTFDCLEQNDGDGGVTHVGRHNYADTIGWFTPRALDAPPAPSEVPAAPELPVEPAPVPAVAAEPADLADPVGPVVSQVPSEFSVNNMPTPEPTPEPPAPILNPVKQDAPVTPVVSPIKPGYKTTEFYVSLALLALPFANLVLGTHISSDAAALFVTTLVSSVGALVGPASYIVGRLSLKGAK